MTPHHVIDSVTRDRFLTMLRAKSIWFGSLALAITVACIALAATDNRGKYEYLSIIQDPYRAAGSRIEVFTPTAHYDWHNPGFFNYSDAYMKSLFTNMNLTINRKPTTNEWYDLNDLFNGLANQGWELITAETIYVESGLETSTHMVRYVMRRSR